MRDTSGTLKGLVETFVQLMVQSHLKSLYDLIAYSWDEASASVKGDLAAVVTEVRTRYTADPVGTEGPLAGP